MKQSLHCIQRYLKINASLGYDSDELLNFSIGAETDL